MAFLNTCRIATTQRRTLACTLHLVSFFFSITHRPTFFRYGHTYCTLEYTVNEGYDGVSARVLQFNSDQEKGKKKVSLLLHVRYRSPYVNGIDTLQDVNFF
jgi:hypothetical protein